jgi:2-polyprenyl-3-methyl-5-hydroxy-6-metoxy-1,4-benzoquinol methylase
MSPADPVRRNIVGNNRVARVYDDWHPEIFTEMEQDRLSGALSRALSATGASPAARALDFGCGSGNVTRHLVSLGCEVVAADVACKFLDIVEEKLGSTGRVETVLLNGRDLSALQDRTFDLIALYSVLHHVPDYIGVVEELARMLRPGGVLFMDHEMTDAYWDGSETYDEFLARACHQAAPRAKTIARFFKPRNYFNKARDLYIRLSGLTDQGDIHVFPDDHIEWARIEDSLAAMGFIPVLSEDYLLFRAHYDVEVFREYEQRCSDVHVLALRRPSDVAPQCDRASTARE